MRRYVLGPHFVRDFRALEALMSPADLETFDALLAAIVRDPESPQRVPSFYDPIRPSWLRRADPFLVHYAFNAERDEVAFLNLFRRR